MSLDTREIADQEVAQSYQRLRVIGQEKAEKFFKEHLISRRTPIDATLPKNKMPLFAKPIKKDLSKQQQAIDALKQDISLFSKLYVVSQVKETDMKEFFFNENQLYPPALSDFGSMHQGVKSDLLVHLEDAIPNHDAAGSPELADMVICDGVAIVNMIAPGTAMTFDEYVDKILNYIRQQFRGCVKRVDIVFDKYEDDSLKNATRKKRGKGGRQRVEAKGNLPKNWKKFMKNSGNQHELFDFIAKKITKEDFPGLVIANSQDEALSSVPTDLKGINGCSAEEADGKIFLHAKDGANKGHKKILIRTVDTDVVVLGISLFDTIGCESLWVTFGVGGTYRLIDVSGIVVSLGPLKCKALPLFHALTGCDVTSSFSGRGKRTAWNTWQAYDQLTAALSSIMQNPSEDTISQALPVIERFVILLYDKCSTEMEVNAARQELFTKGREIENIPPTKDALQQHILRAEYQAAYVWNQALVLQPTLPNRKKFGWIEKNSSWEPRWMTLPLPARLAELYLNVGVPQLVVQKVNVHARRTHWHAPLSANVVVLVAL